MTDCDVLIVGAGPTGLVLALWLTKLGVKARIVDKTAAPGTASRALAVQARTLEFYRQLDLAEAVIERAHKVPGVNLWTRGEHRARIAFEDVGRGLTRFPGLWVFPQDEHERLLIGRLSAMGVFVERERELVGFSENADRGSATLRCADGTAESCEARFLAACDGAHSLIRETLGVGFPGGDYAQIFYVADVEASGRPIDGELHIDLDEADFLAVFPLRGRRRARLIGTVRDERAKQARNASLRGRERARNHTPEGKSRSDQLVLDLSRASSGRRTLPKGAVVPARRRGAHPQSGRRPGHEHRHRRRDQSRLEAESGARRSSVRRAARQLRN